MKEFWSNVSQAMYYVLIILAIAVAYQVINKGKSFNEVITGEKTVQTSEESK